MEYNIPITTPEQLEGIKQADEERKKICEQVLENDRLRKLEKLKPKPIKKK